MKKFFHTPISFSFIFFIAFCFLETQLSAQVSVLTQHNDLHRTGWMNQESKLNQSNVNAATFGKLYTRYVDDQIYAQPLVVSNISVGGKTRNVLFVATVSNSIYAFDADDSTAATLWQVNLTPSGYRVISHNDMTCDWGGYGDMNSNIGIVGTPVIDPNTKTLYVVARSVSTTTGTFVQYLHAIDIITGADKPNSPTYITATYPGSTPDAVNGIITFDEKKQNQRPGLLLYNNVIYIAWASHCDYKTYHGWVIGYDATTLQQKYVYNDTPDGSNGMPGSGGIWMSGQAPTVDDQGYIYVATGNGSVGHMFTNPARPNDTINRGESLLKLSTQSGNLKVVDFFTPHDWLDMEDGDLDYGSDGVMIIPNTTISVSGSKQSYLYVVNTNGLGGTTDNDAGAKQILDINAEFNGDKHIHGTPIYFRNNLKKEYIYVWAEDGLLKQIPFIRKKQIFDTANTVIGTTLLPEGMPGAMLAVSSNYLKRNTGIVWASHPLSGNADGNTVPGIFQAFDANDVTHELWNSQQNVARDGSGNFAKFVCPTVANGKVYLATFSNKLLVYGLLPKNAANGDKANIKPIALTKVTNAIIDVFPNPARDQVTVMFNSKNAKSQKSLLMLLNSVGKVVYKQPAMVNPAANTLTVHLPNSVRNGVYLIQLITADGFTATKKLVIEKNN